MSDPRKTNRVDKELALLRGLPDTFKFSRNNTVLGTLITVSSLVANYHPCCSSRFQTLRSLLQ